MQAALSRSVDFKGREIWADNLQRAGPRQAKRERRGSSKHVFKSEKEPGGRQEMELWQGR